jgi:hypothetical protein
MTEPKYQDDFWVDKRSGVDQLSGERVEAFTVSGPGITMITFATRPEAEAKGRDLARANGASLWYRDSPKAGTN